MLGRMMQRTAGAAAAKDTDEDDGVAGRALDRPSRRSEGSSGDNGGSAGLARFSRDDASLGLLQPAQLAPSPGAPVPLVPAAPGRSLLEAWRSRRLDWHDLVKPMSTEGDAAAGAAAKFSALVNGELDVISLLQGFRSLRGSGVSAATRAGAAELAGAAAVAGQRAQSGGEAGLSPPDPLDISAYYAPSSDWGPLAKFASCDIVRDKCAIHATDYECALDELCGVSAAGSDG